MKLIESFICRFVDTKEMPETFPYRAKAFFAFEEIDGVDVCFFGVHVQVLFHVFERMITLLEIVTGNITCSKHGSHEKIQPNAVT